MRTKRSLLASSALAAAFMMAGLTPAAADNTVTIPWDISFEITPNIPQPGQPFGLNSSAEIVDGGFDGPGLNVFADLAINTNHQLTYTVNLPLDVTISAPDTVFAPTSGNPVTIGFDSSVSFRSNPTFNVAGTVDYATALTIDYGGRLIGLKDTFETTSFDLPNINGNGFDVNFQGDGSFSATDTTPEEVLVRTGAPSQSDPLGNNLDSANRAVLGQQLSTRTTVDGPEASVQLLDLAGNALPIADLISLGIDLEVDLGLDLVQETAFTLRNIDAYYFFPDAQGDLFAPDPQFPLNNTDVNPNEPGLSFFANILDDISLNGANGTDGALQLPDGIGAGDTFDIQFQALGFGADILFDFLLQGNLDLDLLLLDILPGIDPINIASFDFGDPFFNELFITKVRGIDFLLGQGPDGQDNFLEGVIPREDLIFTFDVVSGNQLPPAGDPLPDLREPESDELLPLLNEPFDGDFSLPGTGPLQGNVVVQVSAPPTLALLAPFAVLAAAAIRRRKVRARS